MSSRSKKIIKSGFLPCDADSPTIPYQYDIDADGQKWIETRPATACSTHNTPVHGQKIGGMIYFS